jgi:hypothetical protein
MVTYNMGGGGCESIAALLGGRVQGAVNGQKN